MADNIHMIKVPRGFSGYKQNLEVGTGVYCTCPHVGIQDSQNVKTPYLTNKQPTRFDQIQRYKIV